MSDDPTPDDAPRDVTDEPSTLKSSEVPVPDRESSEVPEQNPSEVPAPDLGSSEVPVPEVPKPDSDVPETESSELVAIQQNSVGSDLSASLSTIEPSSSLMAHAAQLPTNKFQDPSFSVDLTAATPNLGNISESPVKTPTTSPKIAAAREKRDNAQERMKELLNNAVATVGSTQPTEDVAADQSPATTRGSPTNRPDSTTTRTASDPRRLFGTSNALSTQVPPTRPTIRASNLPVTLPTIPGSGSTTESPPDSKPAARVDLPPKTARAASAPPSLFYFGKGTQPFSTSRAHTSGPVFGKNVPNTGTVVPTRVTLKDPPASSLGPPSVQPTMPQVSAPAPIPAQIAPPQVIAPAAPSTTGPSFPVPVAPPAAATTPATGPSIQVHVASPAATPAPSTGPTVPVPLTSPTMATALGTGHPFSAPVVPPTSSMPNVGYVPPGPTVAPTVATGAAPTVASPTVGVATATASHAGIPAGFHQAGPPTPPPAPPAPLAPTPSLFPAPPTPPSPPNPPSPTHSDASGDLHPDLDGCDWRMHRVDPRNIDTLMVRDVPHGISTLRPWRYPRPETGTVRNHAVRFRAQFASKDAYLRSIRDQRLGTENYTVKSYLYTFPKLPKNATEAQICDFYHRVCRHGSGQGVYVPPFATQTHANHTGLWYDDLPAHCVDNWDYYDQVLHQALTGSSANLGDSDLTRHLVAEFSGYQILWLLAYIAGHPGVAISVLQPNMPYQKRDMSLHDYMQLWLHFLHLEHCRGVAYSDVYFVETWLEHLHPSFNDTVKPLILGLLRDCPRDAPVPIHFSPEHLITYVCSRVVSIGVRNLTPASTPTSLSSSAKGRSGSSSAIRQIESATPYMDVRLLEQELADDVFATVNSLMASNTSRSCDLCKATDHLVASCPILHRVISDPDRTRRVLASIEKGRANRGGSQAPQQGSQDRNRTPLRGNRSAQVSEIAEADTDEDAAVTQLTDDEGDSQEKDF